MVIPKLSYLPSLALIPSMLAFTGAVIAAAPSPATAPTDLLGADKTPTGYLTATVPRQWSFPLDHGRHDGFKTEWWYFTGNVADTAGRKFGYQVTFFRVAISPLAVPKESALSLGDYYFAHAAVSDLAGGQFYFKDRIEPGRDKIASSATDTLDVALRDWSARLQRPWTQATSAPANGQLAGQPSDGIVSLDATDAGFGIHLNCNCGVGPVLEGPGGINRKGRERAQASYYYSMPHMPTSGTIVVKNETFRVTGVSWMDHEFSSNALGANQIGWDWVGLTLADGRSLMVYRLRNKAGDADFLSGTLIDATGHPKYLMDKDITFQGGSPWKSVSGGAYPQIWSLTVAGLPPMTIHSRMPNQELRTDATTKIDYFEGSCDVTTTAGQSYGEGYLEMTGYAKPLSPF